MENAGIVIVSDGFIYAVIVAVTIVIVVWMIIFVVGFKNEKKEVC